MQLYLVGLCLCISFSECRIIRWLWRPISYVWNDIKHTLPFFPWGFHFACFGGRPVGVLRVLMVSQLLSSLIHRPFGFKMYHICLDFITCTLNYFLLVSKMYMPLGCPGPIISCLVSPPPRFSVSPTGESFLSWEPRMTNWQRFLIWYY